MANGLTWAMIIAGLGILGIIYSASKRKESARKFLWIGLVAGIIGVLAIGNVVPQLSGLNSKVSFGGSSLSVTDNTAGSNPSGVQSCPIQTTATYTAKDKFSSNIVTATTAYYKANGLPATTTATTNLNPGVDYTYWASNGTYYVLPEKSTASCGVNTFIADSWQNGSASITGYDLVNRASNLNGAYNSSMGANKLASIEFTYQGTNKKSFMPFGGVFVVEYNSTISSVSCTGNQILQSNPYGVTYTTQATTNTFRVFGVSSDFDDGSGSVRTVNCQFQNGASATAGSNYYVTFIPANYYVANSGDIVLDVEKTANQDTTRVGLGQLRGTGIWGA